MVRVSASSRPTATTRPGSRPKPLPGATTTTSRPESRGCLPAREPRVCLPAVHARRRRRSREDAASHRRGGDGRDVWTRRDAAGGRRRAFTRTPNVLTRISADEPRRRPMVLLRREDPWTRSTKLELSIRTTDASRSAQVGARARERRRATTSRDVASRGRGRPRRSWVREPRVDRPAATHRRERARRPFDAHPRPGSGPRWTPMDVDLADQTETT